MQDELDQDDYELDGRKEKVTLRKIAKGKTLYCLMSFHIFPLHSASAGCEIITAHGKSMLDQS